MFLKVKLRNQKQYLSLVESYWQAGKAHQRTVASLGCVDHFQPAQLKVIGQKLIDLAGTDSDSDSTKKELSTLEELERINWGAHLIYASLWQRFSLDYFFKKLTGKTKLQFDLAASIFAIVLARLMAPSSKLQVYHCQSYYYGQQDVSLQHLYRCLDRLADAKESLETHLFERNRTLFNATVELVFYDVTTLYFESTLADEFKNFGYSKDCKFNEVQVVVGLLLDNEGRPIGFDVYPGNTFEGKTLTSALEKLKHRFNIQRVVVVADRGLNAKSNLKAIRDAGYHYIVGSRLKSLPKAMQKEVLDLASYTEIQRPNATSVFKLKTLAHTQTLLQYDDADQQHMMALEDKIVCSWSEKRARKDCADRQRLIEKARQLIETPSQLSEKRGAKKYIKRQADQHPTLREEKIAEDARWDGIYGIQCSDKTLSENEILEAYHCLWRIEEAFRVSKSGLEMRPIYHWTPSRIQGHLTSCFIAFLLERSLELELRNQQIDYSTGRIREAIAAMQASKVSCEGHLFYLRAPLPSLAKQILTTLKLTPPKTFTPEADFLN